MYQNNSNNPVRESTKNHIGQIISKWPISFFKRFSFKEKSVRVTFLGLIIPSCVKRKASERILEHTTGKLELRFQTHGFMQAIGFLCDQTKSV